MELPLSSTVVETTFSSEDQPNLGAPRRQARVLLVVASACALLALAAYVVTGSKDQATGTELMWGGPLSFDMVHTHILNMKMRRSRLKEKLKQAALMRKDREIAQEHGFNNQGNLQSSQAPSAPPAQQQQMAQAPPQPMYQQPPPMMQQPQYEQQPQMYQQPMQQPMQQQPMQQQPMYGQQPPQFQGNPYQQLPQQPPMYEQQPPQYGQPEPGYPPQYAAPPEAPQLAQAPPPGNPWGGMTVNQAPEQQVHVGGPTESSSDDKDQQRAQAAASIQAYEQFMHGGAPAAPAKAAPGGAQGMMMHA
eukprot:CAMPEP_0181319510 /NCGR_PEP_ID=MMETSP1101-20121128/17614_1 /TAXON_ID=46948 /ORGANISM="Rhodomonas abbreviata, Strain Caron Lab Isolate" /LENGTH=303 /DNA_ID=CAMNT_0023427123 /DNA_START=28 /DNA_END=939 /DNA_ORIENTATION=-